MANRQYVGARYVPKFADPVEWNSALSYEALTIVTHLGNSFTSKKPVPAGVDIGNTEYWVNTGNYNEQVATYQTQVTNLSKFVNNSCVPITAYGAVGDGATDCTNAIIEASQIGNGYIIIPKGEFLISGSAVIPDSVGLMFAGGKLIIKGSLKCGTIVADKYNIFSVTGSLTVNESLTPVGYPEWFGDDVIECYKYFKTIELAPKTYTVNKPLKLNKSNTRIYGINSEYYASNVTKIILTENGSISVGDEVGNIINNFPRAISLQNFTIEQTNVNSNCLSVYGVINGIFEKMIFTGNSVKNTVSCTKSVYTKFIDCTSFVVHSNGEQLRHFYMTDGGNPIAAGGNASLYFIRCNATTAGTPGGTGWFNDGVVSDIYLDSCESASCEGFSFVSSTPRDGSYNDIIISNCVFDAAPTNGCTIYIPYKGTFVMSNTYISLTANNDFACFQYAGGDMTLLINDCQFVCPTNNGIGFQCLGKVQGKVNASVNGPAIPYSISGEKTNLRLTLWNKGVITE